MNKIWVAAAMLALVIALCITEGTLTTSLPRDLQEDIQTSVQCVERLEYDDARSHIDKAKEDVETTRTMLSTFTPHDRFENIEKNVSLLDSLLEHQEYDTFIIVAEQADELIKRIEISESLRIENIF